jgi:hypothetical protein
MMVVDDETALPNASADMDESGKDEPVREKKRPRRKKKKVEEEKADTEGISEKVET